MEPQKTIIFYIGYCSLKEKDNYGSELALINVATELSKKHKVFVFGPMCNKLDLGEVKVDNSSNLLSFMKSHSIDLAIISRYIHYFLEFPIVAKKTYVWLHDMVYQPYWNGQEMPQMGKYLIFNLLEKIDGLITLTPWHREFVINNYELPPGKVLIIGNGINGELFDAVSSTPKVPYRFIWTSDVCRGLTEVVNYFPQIKKEFPQAELFIFRGLESFNGYEALLEKIKKSSYMHYIGKLPQEVLAKEFYKADIWLYPTTFKETFCMSGLEALRAGCFCIASDLAALHDTIGVHGILLNVNPKSEEGKTAFLNAVRKALTNPGYKHEIQKISSEWAKAQTWSNRVSEWETLL